MALKLHNTLSRKKEEFESINPGKVGIYTCGPTVYNFIHIGNLRTFLISDLLERALLLNGFATTRVENITDIDDKTILGAKESNTKLKEFTKKYTDEYLSNLDKLKIKAPSASPKATETENISAMIDMINLLLEKDHAYKADDGIYFRISSLPNYGAFGGVNSKEAVERINNDEYDKESVSDFVLWKFESDPDISFEAPFGQGRPGWHIECSAMIHRIMGEPIDIHTGGVDLIFPHHTNEVAQTEAAFGVPISKYWLHNEFITVDGKKMSKSLGNVYTLSDILNKGFNPLSLRYFYLTAHYRQTQNFTWEALEASENAYKKIVRFLKRNKEVQVKDEVKNSYTESFTEAVNDDLNMPEALASLWKTIDDENLDENEKVSTVFWMDKVLGLNLKEESGKEVEIPEEVRKLILEREEARKEKDWQKSDEIRDRIKELGFEIEDTESGPLLEQN